jgi:serine/threonine protein kinase
MSLASGTRLGPYVVAEPLGAGGMVYRPRDTRLGRDVAVKVVADAAAGDAERLARFTQEARATAALNHPNIVAVLDVGDAEGHGPFIVSDLLELPWRSAKG